MEGQPTSPVKRVARKAVDPVVWSQTSGNPNATGAQMGPGHTDAGSFAGSGGMTVISGNGKAGKPSVSGVAMEGTTSRAMNAAPAPLLHLPAPTAQSAHPSTGMTKALQMYEAKPKQVGAFGLPGMVAVPDLPRRKVVVNASRPEGQVSVVSVEEPIVSKPSPVNAPSAKELSSTTSLANPEATPVTGLGWNPGKLATKPLSYATSTAESAPPAPTPSPVKSPSNSDPSPPPSLPARHPRKPANDAAYSPSVSSPLSSPSTSASLPPSSSLSRNSPHDTRMAPSPSVMSLNGRTSTFATPAPQGPRIVTGSFGGAVGAAAANTEQEKRDKAEVDKLRKLLKEQKESHDQQVRELSSTLAQKNKEYLTVSSQTASQMEIAGKLMAEANKRLLDAGLSVLPTTVPEVQPLPFRTPEDSLAALKNKLDQKQKLLQSRMNSLDEQQKEVMARDQARQQSLQKMKLALSGLKLPEEGSDAPVEIPELDPVIPAKLVPKSPTKESGKAAVSVYKTVLTPSLIVAPVQAASILPKEVSVEVAASFPSPSPPKSKAASDKPSPEKPKPVDLSLSFSLDKPIAKKEEEEPASTVTIANSEEALPKDDFLDDILKTMDMKFSLSD